MQPATWIVVPIKDFHTAKSRLASTMAPRERSELARRNATRALHAAVAVAPTIAVCGTAEVAAMARACGALALVEDAPGGQNAAGARGLSAVLERGARAALLLSADLPLVDAPGLGRMLQRATPDEGDVVIAAAATGRHGINALYLRPPDGFELCFGEASLPRFAAEARRRGRTFIIVDEPSLALDIDEPSDLRLWALLRESA